MILEGYNFMIKCQVIKMRVIAIAKKIINIKKVVYKEFQV